MGVAINPRGTSGAGKTEFARRVMADYGWPGGDAEAVHRRGRERPIGHVLRHPFGGRPLAVLGHYGATGGGGAGCGTITAKDGGLPEAFRLAEAWASCGYDVLLEGSSLSREHLMSAALAEAYELRVLRLATPLDRCVRNVVARRRASRDARLRIARVTAALDAEVEEACDRLRRSRAGVEALRFDDALRRARHLLGLGDAMPGACELPDRRAAIGPTAATDVS